VDTPVLDGAEVEEAKEAVKWIVGLKRDLEFN